jgi:hypothetical protein
MRRIWLAIRVFFLVLFKAEVARRVAEALAGREEVPRKALTPGPSPTRGEGREAASPVAQPAARSDALTLLATLQREARLVDFVQEPLEGYSDAQIGAAARDVHRECGKVLQRLFALRPILTAAEDSAVEVPAGFDGGRYRLIGNVTGQPPFHGRLVHHGWEAEKCQLPAWSGAPTAARVVAPVEVEL